MRNQAREINSTHLCYLSVNEQTLGSLEVASAASWQLDIWPDRANKSEKVTSGKTCRKPSRGQTEGVTPPIDQRPSSSLLSFLHFVNFSKSSVDSGASRSDLFWQAFISFRGILGASGLTRSTTRRDFPPPFLRSSWSLCGNHLLSTPQRGKKNTLTALICQNNQINDMIGYKQIKQTHMIYFRKRDRL